MALPVLSGSGFAITRKDTAGQDQQCHKSAGGWVCARQGLDLAPPAIDPQAEITKQDHLFAMVFHHTIIDGASMGILRRELVQTYAASRQGRTLDLPEPRIRFGDYAAWEARQYLHPHKHAEVWWSLETFSQKWAECLLAAAQELEVR